MFTKYFYGHEISPYGQQNKRVDYATFAKAFDAVLNNEIMGATYDLGYWEPVSGERYYDSDGNTYTPDERDEEVERLEARRDELEEAIAEAEDLRDEAINEAAAAEISRDIDGMQDELDDVENNLEALENAEEPEVYQWYIVDDNGARICEEFGEVLYYNEALDMYLWGVTHYGTAWDYVLTGIPCNPEA